VHVEGCASADHRPRVVVDADEVHGRGDDGQVTGFDHRCVGAQVVQNVLRVGTAKQRVHVPAQQQAVFQPSPVGIRR